MDPNIGNLAKSFPPWLLLGAGAALGYLKSFWSFFYDHTIGWASNKCKVELVVEEQDHVQAFVWVNLWMEKRLKEKKISKLRIQKKSNRIDSEDDNAFELLPSYGFYWRWWKRRLLTFYSEKKESGGDSYSSKKLIRTITLELWGTRNRDLLTEIVSEAKAEFEKNAPNNIKFYTHSSDYWDSYSMSVRDLDSVYLPDKQLEDILSDFDTFFASRSKYSSLGIPWRRTLLLEGPPGSGKSTLVQALSSHFNIPIYYLNAGKVVESAARELLYSVQSPCIILMEDIDSIPAAKIRKETKTTVKKEKGEGILSLSPSELLNLLDGIIATENRIVIMTTNHPEMLDPAILRPGRTDRVFHIGYARTEELQKFYNRAKEYYSLPSYPEFRKQLKKNCTIADAQGLVFSLNSDIEVNLVQDLTKDFTKDLTPDQNYDTVNE